MHLDTQIHRGYDGCQPAFQTQNIPLHENIELQYLVNVNKEADNTPEYTNKY